MVVTILVGKMFSLGGNIMQFLFKPEYRLARRFLIVLLAVCVLLGIVHNHERVKTDRVKLVNAQEKLVRDTNKLQEIVLTGNFSPSVKKLLGADVERAKKLVHSKQLQTVLDEDETVLQALDHDKFYSEQHEEAEKRLTDAIHTAKEKLNGNSLNDTQKNKLTKFVQDGENLLATKMAEDYQKFLDEEKINDLLN
jgi:hypothetical protein